MKGWKWAREERVRLEHREAPGKVIMMERRRGKADPGDLVSCNKEFRLHSKGNGSPVTGFCQKTGAVITCFPKLTLVVIQGIFAARHGGLRSARGPSAPAPRLLLPELYSISLP